MAKTTFSGPVRSENNYKVVSKTASTGLVHDRTMGSGVKDARRYYLEEWFNQRPQMNASLASATEATRVVANRDFETLGTNMTNALTTFSSTHGGILMTTAGADEDQAILLPHLDTAQTAWTGTTWGTENSVEWEASISLPALDNQKVWAGLPITVAANTPYHLKISIDSDRKATIFVNGIQYNITTTSGSTGGTAVTEVQPSKVAVKTAALTNDVSFEPYIGIEAGDGAAEAINVHYQAISRLVFE